MKTRYDSAVADIAEMAIMDQICHGVGSMRTMSAKDAKNAFGMLIDCARAEPVVIEKHGRKVVVVMAIEEYERLISGKSEKPITNQNRPLKKREFL